MLSRRCHALSAHRLTGHAAHLPALRHDSRAVSCLSGPLSAQLFAPHSVSSPPSATALPPPQKPWVERWKAGQILAAAAPSYFSGVLQSRFTQAPPCHAPADKISASPAPATSLSAALALVRRLSYLDQLYTRIGLSPQQSRVPLSAAEQATLATPLAQLLRRQQSRSVSSSEEGLMRSKDGNNNNKGSNKDNKSKKDENKEGEGGEGEEEDKPEDWIVPRTCLFVLVMVAVTVVLYQLSRPSGKHTGWASLNRRAGEIKEVALYENYLQVYMDEAKVYLGLVSDHDTQRHIDELAANYRTARVKAVKEEEEQQQKKEASAAAQNNTSSKKESTDEGGDVLSAAAAAAAPFFKSKAANSAAEKPEELDVRMKGRPLAETALMGVGVFAWVVPFIFFPVFVMFLSQYIGKSMSFAVEATKGKSKVKEMIFAVEKSSTTRFRDVAGMKEPKKEITEIVDFLRHPERYTKLGAKIPTGAMLLGPPGTGKTLLAKAVAGESGVAFIPAIGSDFVELYVGMGALRVRQLFKEARKQRCIIYIDEIDAIGLKRQGAGHGEKQEQEQTLNELLTQLDGFSTGKRGDIMVLASSNVAQEALDPALIRPGRFDRIIHVDTPVISERIDIFKVHLSKLKLVSDDVNKTKKEAEAAATEAADASPAEEKVGVQQGSATAAAAAAAATETIDTTTNATGNSLVLSTVEAEKKAYEAEATSSSNKEDTSVHDFDFRALLMQKSAAERAMIDVYAARMSNLCPGFVGADIANVCNEGAILAAREGADHVDISHLERSIDRVLAGIEHRSRAMSDFEKNVVAHHEAGHAVAGWFLNRADPLMKVSIVPRGGSALGYAQYLPNENYTRTAKEIRDSISVTLGGRVAEQIFFQHLSTGASDDLRKVGRMAYQYVSSFAPGSVYPAPGTNSTRLVKPFGVNKSNDFDRRAKTLVDDVYADTVALLTEHKEDMKKLADHLLKHELLTYSDVVHYLGSRSTRQADKKKGV